MTIIASILNAANTIAKYINGSKPLPLAVYIPLVIASLAYGAYVLITVEHKPAKD